MLAQMETKLRAALQPATLKVFDDSAAHYGHDGATPGQVSHVALLVVSATFEGKSPVERSRMVYAALAEEMKTVHAVTQLKTLTPAEYEVYQRQHAGELGA